MISLLPFAAAALVLCRRSAAGRPGMATEPDDPNAAPYPPDGVTDPNAEYPTDGTEGTDQGEAATDPTPAGCRAARRAGRLRNRQRPAELIGLRTVRH